MIGILITVMMAGATIAPPAPHIKAALAEYQMASMALKSGNANSAIIHFRETIAIEPTYMEAYRGLIAAEESANKTAEMARTITQMLQIEPDAISYRLKLADYLLQSGDAQRALAQYSLGLETDPSNGDALFGLMRAAVKAGMPDRAALAKIRGHQLYPSDGRFL